MFKPILYNTKAKVILLRSGHYRRVVEINDDDIEAFASIESSIVSVLNLQGCKCCTEGGEYILSKGLESSDNVEVHPEEQSGNSPLWEPRFPPPSSIGGGLSGPTTDSSDRTRIDLGATLKIKQEAPMEVDIQPTSKDGVGGARESLPLWRPENVDDIKINIVKDEVDDEVDINEGVSVLFYINSKDTPVDAIAKIDSDKRIIVLTRKYMNRFFPVKLITKLVTNENELFKYKENIYKNKEDLSCCIVIHAKNFQRPIGIEFKSKNIKRKFVDSLTGIYNMYTFTPTVLF